MNNSDEQQFISGSGGLFGGGGNKPPIEEQDSLQSNAIATILDLLCEGEIFGLVDGYKSIFFDGTRVENADGSRNFQGFIADLRPGTQSQDILEYGLASEVRAENPVGVDVTVAQGAVVRSIVDADVDSVVVRIAIPSLVEQKDNGDLVGASVNFTIAYQPNGGGYITAVNDTITGKNTSLYEKQYRFSLTGSAPWNIRVTRITPDSTNTKLQNATRWQSFVAIKSIKLRYPNTAIIGVAFNASNFRSVPRRTYLIKGRKIRIPINGTVSADGGIDYTGAWDGNFKTEWCADPAWVLYDLITNTRFGAGEYISEGELDKFAFYSVSQYCNQQVPNGLGGFERRFLANVYIRSRREAFQLINELSTVFRGTLYWSGGKAIPIIDKPDIPASKVFTQASVIDGEFNYSGSSRRARHTLALVQWIDANDNYEPKIEAVYDREGIKLYGIREVRIDAFGATTRGQAYRAGKGILTSERLETETVTFRIAGEGNTLAFGEIFRVRNSYRDGFRSGGRIKAATLTNITVDDPVTIAIGTTYTIALLNAATGALVERGVTNAGGTYTTLNLASALPNVPLVGSSWILYDNNNPGRVYRTISITEAETTETGETIFEITGLLYASGKFAEIDGAVTLGGQLYTNIPNDVAPPVNVTAGYFVVSSNGIDYYTLQAAWGYPVRNGAPDPYVGVFEVEFQDVADGLWRDRRGSRINTFFWENLRPSTYKVRVRTVDVFGRLSVWVESSTAINMNQVGGSINTAIAKATFTGTGAIADTAIITFTTPKPIFVGSGSVT